MTSPPEKLDIVVGEFPTDAALFNVNGVRTLFMSSGQTFSTAVRNVRNVLPGITIEAAERMIREQCQEFRDLDDLLGLTDPVPPSVERPPVEPVSSVRKEQLPRKRRGKVILVAALLPALAASWALGRYTNVVDSTPAQTEASSPDAISDSSEIGSAAAQQAPFNDSKFEFFAGSSKIECDPISTLEAECTDSDGMVMSTKVATGPDSSIFTFSYGSERIGLRIFYDAEYADTWARQDGSRELYPNMKVHNRYVLWGTDPERIAEYAQLLEDAGSSPTAMGGATPLPPRLAALTLGTLGLDSQDVHQIIARPAAAAADVPTMLAARLVLGLDPAPVFTKPVGDDIVALAAGIEPPPPSTGPTEPTDEGSTTPTSPTPEPSTPPADEDPAPSESEPAAGAEPSPEEPAPSESEPPAADEEPSPEEPAPSESEPPAEEEPPQEPAPEEPKAHEPEAPADEEPTPEEPAPSESEAPAEGGTPPGQDTAPPGNDEGHGDAGEDLLILDSVWTVAVF
ncbi:hypothetical protein [Streptomyces xantholiticus]|uniref:Uncharacterized protein n=1 Tax=Streptomyces xantholiticus TaxID=68285 RepID=A0ABV1V007_9ACTN